MMQEANFPHQWNKKGLSPLIATLILVVIAIAAGALIMWFGRDYLTTIDTSIDDSSGRLSCSTDIDVDVMNACFDPSLSVINFIVANKRNTKIVNDNFYLQIYQESNIAMQPFAIDNLGP